MMMYKKYKETGYKHIPTIPEHWEIKKHRSFLVEQKSINSNDEGTLLSLSQYTGVSIKTNTDKQGMFRAESLVGYRIVHPQDIVMNIMLAWNGSTACSKFEGVISPAYAVFKVADNGIAPDYLHYLYRIPEMCGYFKAYSTGIIDSRLRLYPQIFMQLYSVIPPRDEQDQIVRYLDWQVSKINHLIHSYQKQIKLLEERKITLIDNAVTKGINSDATMQHILGCWMGNIPAHWRMIPSKRVFVEGKERRREGDVSATASQKYGIISAKKRTLQKSENRLAELDRLFKRIYEDMVNGKLSEARFQMLSDDYEQEQADLRAKIEMLENEIQNQEDQAENVDRFIRQAKKYLYLEKLTPTILNDMVNAIYVHAPDKSSGHRVQDVTISYNYIGILPANLLYDVMNGKAA